jgi:A/G-specific adenine glycosylase
MSFQDIVFWYEKHQRPLIFRQTQNPYYIWISEIMLQQTQVITMVPYYETFIKKFPTIEALASSDLEEVLQVLKGIGYYRRFKMMHQCAKVIMASHQGIFPNTYDEVIKLPGIGLYTAGAIMSIAFKKPYSALDGNVMRVLTRVFEISDDVKQLKTQKKLDALNQSLIDHRNPDLYTHAMMEIGATICKPSQPMCDQCPLQDICQSYQHQTYVNFPYKSKATPKKEIFYQTILCVNDHHQVLIKKETQTLFEGMYLFPQFEVESLQSSIEALQSQGIQTTLLHSFDTIKHVFTHQVWHMKPIMLKFLAGNIEGYIWQDIDSIEHALMPRAHSKLQIFLKR